MIRSFLTIGTLFAVVLVLATILFTQNGSQTFARAYRIRSGHRRIERGKADRAGRYGSATAVSSASER
jgi:hypothetical protein